MIRHHPTIPTIFTASLLLFSPVQASDPENLINYRQSVMRVIGGHTSASAAIIQGKIEHTEHLQTHAEGLAAASTLIRDLFPPESAEGETDALPRIWEEPDRFNEKIERAEAAITDYLTAVSEDGNVGAALRDMGAACRSCHDDYRVSR